MGQEGSFELNVCPFAKRMIMGIEGKAGIESVAFLLSAASSTLAFFLFPLEDEVDAQDKFSGGVDEGNRNAAILSRILKVELHGMM
jgi:hypothetical protein